MGSFPFQSSITRLVDGACVLLSYLSERIQPSGGDGGDQVEMRCFCMGMKITIALGEHQDSRIQWLLCDQSFRQRTSRRIQVDGLRASGPGGSLHAYPCQVSAGEHTIFP